MSGAKPPRHHDYRAGLWRLLTPFVVGVTVLVLLPAVVTAGYAFTYYDSFGSPEWAGLGVFRDLSRDPEVHDSLRATAAFLALAVPLRIAGGLLLALGVQGRERSASTTRLAVYTPAVVPEPATALVWLWIVNPFFGPLGAVVRLLGGTPGPVLLDPWGARLTLVGLSAFALGEGFLVTLAARRELPASLYDVARVEGAGAVTAFRRVTLPLLAPTLGLLVARDVLMSLQVALVPTLLLTRGGPLNATKTLPVLIYERGFAESQLGDAAALSLLLVGCGVLAVALQFRLLRRWSRTAPD